MTAAVTSPRPVVLADLLPGGRVRDLCLTVGGAGLTGLAAQLAVHTPWSPVPFTFQTMTVLLVGAALGSARGAASMLVYLAAGWAGVPWFAGHTHSLAGSSAGYVVGFVLAAAAVGQLTERRADRRLLSTALALVAGNLIVYAVGASWLAVSLHLDASRAFALGVRPFLATDAIKCALAAAALPATWAWIGHRESRG